MHKQGNAAGIHLFNKYNETVDLIKAFEEELVRKEARFIIEIIDIVSVQLNSPYMELILTISNNVLGYVRLKWKKSFKSGTVAQW